jgi:gas vesicle protein
MRFSGIALIATQSLNGEIFTLESLQKAFNGVTDIKVPVFIDHDYSKIVGEARLWLESDPIQVMYECEANVDREYKGVSIGINVTEWDEASDGTMLIKNFIIYELSLTDNPAIPYVTVDAQTFSKILHKLKPAMKPEPQEVKPEIQPEIKPAVQEVKSEIKSEIQEVKSEIKPAVQEEVKEIKQDVKYNMEDLTKSIKPNINKNELITAIENYALTKTPFRVTIKKEFVDADAQGPALDPYPKYATLTARLERFLNRGEIKGSVAQFVTFTVPEWSLLPDDGTNVNDATQNVSVITEDIKYYGYKQTVSKGIQLNSNWNIVQALARTALNLSTYAIDKVMYSKIDGDATITAIYGGGKTSEGTLTSGDKFNVGLVIDIVDSIRKSKKNGKVIIVVSEKQFGDLLRDSNLYNMSISGAQVVGSEKDFYEGIDVYGALVIPMSGLNTGTGSGGITTYHGCALVVGSCAFVAGDPELSVNFDPNKMVDIINIMKPIACKVLDSDAVRRVITA